MAWRGLAFLGVALSAAGPLWAQAQPPAKGSPSVYDAPANPYNPLVTFAPLSFPEPANLIRSPAGAPGAAYWQNRADYRIDARLDPAAKRLSADEVITYTNNSPDALDLVWLQLDQNVYRPDSRGQAMAGGRRLNRQFTEGYTIEAVAVEAGGAAAPADFLVDDTRMRVILPKPLARGAQLKLRVRYHFTIPGEFGGRMAWGDSRNGQIFDLAQWYPRMAVYDDLRGWDTLPYLANEFYLEYGDFDYAVTAPADMIVAGSGELANPDEVLTPDERARLAKARQSDSTVMIRTPEEVPPATKPLATTTRTWRFHMDHTRDVAFSASRAFVWDAARINLPGGKTALAESVYPVESAGAPAWGRSTEYLKDAIEHFSARWFPYPWPNAINIAGPASGMEYPGVLFDGIGDKGAVLFWITAHEIGHSWFPMIVGFDERRNAWMDEGFNTFIDVYESDDFEKGVYGPKRDSEYAPSRTGGTPAEQLAPLLADREAPVIMTRADAIREKYRHPVTYFKSAYGLVLLREDILGPARFDRAFRKFIADWAYKHPKPSDFFRAMESEGGEDLSWFWRGWYFQNWTLDLAVTGVKYVEDNPAVGAEITVENHDQLVLPATLRVTYASGKTVDVRVPAETWMQGGSHVFVVPGGGPVKEAVIDPDRRLPDRDRANNSFRP
jgi:hypothetical protein